MRDDGFLAQLELHGCLQYRQLGSHNWRDLIPVHHEISDAVMKIVVLGAATMIRSACRVLDPCLVCYTCFAFNVQLVLNLLNHKICCRYSCFTLYICITVHTKPGALSPSPRVDESCVYMRHQYLHLCRSVRYADLREVCTS
jgi:hypothetical protein